jgi:hypothetical protein
MISAVGFARAVALLLGVSFAVDAAWADDQAPSPPVAYVDGATPGARTEILSLKRNEGGMVTLRFAFVKTSAEPIPFTAFPGCCGQNATTLVDYTNRKKYLIITDSSGECLCTAISNALNDIDTGRRIIFAKFPAPPESVNKIAVIFAGSEPVDDVPITR